jgi:predicted DNA binding CopG/RHH family protein
MTPAQPTPKTPTETLPRPAGELNDLASYYDTHDTSAEMEHGEWVDLRPMKTTSLRLPADVVEALKARAHQRGIRYTALLREIIESAVHNIQTATNKDLAEINDRLARIEAAITGQPAQTPHTPKAKHSR